MGEEDKVAGIELNMISTSALELLHSCKFLSSKGTDYLISRMKEEQGE